MEDTKIIELFWGRDEAALKEAADKYGRFCFGIAWKILANREDSEECVNDTWFTAWRSIPPARPSILSAFLGRITRSHAIDNLRKKYAAKRMDLHMSSIADITDEAGILNRQFALSLDRQMEEKELIRLINQFLEGLSERDRDIFMRRYWHMDSIAEIAKRHGISESSIKSNLFRTRKKLKRMLMKERDFA